MFTVTAGVKSENLPQLNMIKRDCVFIDVLLNTHQMNPLYLNILCPLLQEKPSRWICGSSVTHYFPTVVNLV